MKTALEAGLARHDEKPYVDESILLEKGEGWERRFVPTRHNSDGKPVDGFIRFSDTRYKNVWAILKK